MVLLDFKTIKTASTGTDPRVGMVPKSTQVRTMTFFGHGDSIKEFIFQAAAATATPTATITAATKHGTQTYH